MKPSFSAWRVGAPYYAPLLAIGILVFAWSVTVGWAFFGWIAFVPGVFTVYFFRDPARSIPEGPGVIVSPADGKVVRVEHLEQSPWYDGPCLHIAIFLNVFNVHVNRSPAACTVNKIAYKEGGYLNAADPKSSEQNEANALWLDTAHGSMTVRQIAGLIARRIVCVTKEGEELERGEKFGMIKFGSRTELYLAPNARAEVKVGDTVQGGSSIVARFDELE